MKRLECLDGLRGALAVYVMAGHLAPFALIPGWIAQALSHGGAAVDVFFILSGQVIVQSLEGFAWRARPFLVARAARTYPVFLAMFVLAVAVQALPTDFAALPWVPAGSPAYDIWSAGWPQAWRAEIALHLVMAHGLVPDGVLPGTWVSFLGAAWSLSTEWQFYLLAWLIGARLGPGWLAAAFLALAAGGIAWHLTAGPDWQFSRAFLPNKAALFALGITSARTRRQTAIRGYGTMLIGTLTLCAASGGAAKMLPPLAWTLCLGAQHRPDLPGLRTLAALLRSRVMLWLGALSYSLYLANEPVQKLLGLLLAGCVRGNGAVFTALWLPGAVLLPIGLAAALHAWLEVPAQRWGRQLAQSWQSVPAGLVVSSSFTRPGP